MEEPESSHKVSGPVALDEYQGWQRLVGPFVSRELLAGGTYSIRLRWGRIAGGVACLVVFTYLALATVAFGLVRYGRGIDQVTLADFLFPQRWSRYRVAVGDAQIARAQALEKEGNLREALVSARAGLARSPTNLDGRLLVAQLLIRSARVDTAEQTLVDGLPFHRADAKFLHPLFTVLLRQQRDSRVVALARSLLPAQPLASESNRLVALAAATASYFRGDFDQADDFLGLVPSLAASRDGLLLSAKIDYARGYRELALLSLRTLATQHPDDLELHTELVQRLRERGLRDEARRRNLAFQIAHPALARPRIELLRDLRDSAEPARAAREVDALLRDFENDTDALLALADFAANTGDAELARRLLGHARTHQLAWEPHALLLVEALVMAREFRTALDAADTLSRENADFAAHLLPILNSLRAIAHFGLGETESGRLLLTNYLNQTYLRAENLLAIAQRLIDVDAASPAHDALLRAMAADPLNQAALTRLVELELNLNRIDELPAHLRRFVAMRRPSPDILRIAQQKLGSDLWLFSNERSAALDDVHAALERQPPARTRL